MSEDATRVCWTVCATNCFFWVLWKTPLRPFMQHAFTHNPLDDRLYTTVTSMFSHRSFVHLVVSCSALTCFGTPIAVWMTQCQDDRVNPSTYESTSEYHLLAFVISSSIVSIYFANCFLDVGMETHDEWPYTVSASCVTTQRCSPFSVALSTVVTYIQISYTSSERPYQRYAPTRITRNIRANTCPRNSVSPCSPRCAAYVQQHAFAIHRTSVGPQCSLTF